MLDKIKNLLNSHLENSEYQTIVERLFEEASGQSLYYNLKIKDCPSYQNIKEKDDAFRKGLMFFTIMDNEKVFEKYQATHWMEWNTGGRRWYAICEALLKSLIRLKTEFTDEELMVLFLVYKKRSEEDKKIKFSNWPLGHSFIQVEKHVKKNGLSDELKAFFEEVLKWTELNVNSPSWGADVKKVKFKMLKLVHGDATAPYQLSEEDAFGVFVNEEMSKLKKTEVRNGFYEMFYHTQKATAGKPPKKYLDKSRKIIEIIGAAAYKKHVQEWLEHIISMKTTQGAARQYSDYPGYIYYKLLEQKNAILAKGLVWSLVQFHDSKTLNILAQLTERAYKKVPGVGPAAGALGNACIYVLAHSKGLEGIGHLSRLRSVIRQNKAKKLIEKYLNAAAERLNIQPAEIEELSIPDFGLVEGSKILEFDDYALEFEVLGIGKAREQWIKPDGSLQKTVPAFVKKNKKHHSKFKKAKEEFKNIKKQLTAQRNRIDRSYVVNREIPYGNFEKYYIQHGLVGFLAKKLIWIFTNGKKEVEVLRQNDIWQNVKGKEVKPTAETKVRLWHPVHAGVEGVIAWRDRLEVLQIRQPMKQAYREVYILTDAEVNTRTYSNRMAAHLLKQHQFSALANLRGWKYSLLGAYDDGRDCEIAILPLKRYGLTAEYWINELYAEGEYSDSGILNYVSTDQVKFLNENQRTIDLVEVPKIVFSEVMRDVDLFVGVASVGNDPNWNDNSGLPQYRDYWQSYSFGDLTEVAKTRKQVLEKLVPRLKIKDIARIDGKFLRVKGKIRAYKIHIGSTNILMEPNDQYLCIVPDAKQNKTGDKVFLPFEGDRGLSVVLSKAFLLAEDDKITDSTIVSQLKR